MTKYRLYRKISRIEYKDIDADSLDDAEKSKEYLSAEGDNWKIITLGLITDWTVTDDTTKENEQIFIERQIAFERRFNEELAK